MDKERLEELIEGFISVKAMQGVSEMIQKQYNADLRRMIIEGRAFDSPKHFRSLFKSYREKYGDWRYSHMVRLMKQFVSWSVPRDIPDWISVEANDLKEVPKRKRQNKTERVAYSHEQVHQILQEAKKHSMTYYGIVWFAFNTGFRRRTLMFLEVTDVSEEGAVMRRENSKTKVEVFVPFPNPEQKKFVQKYLKYRSLLHVSHNYLFVGPRGGLARLNGGFGSRMMKYLSEKTRFRVAFHNMRYTFAVRIWEQTGDIYLVQKLLGHSSPAQTADYLKLNEIDLRDVLNEKLRGVRLV